MKLLYAPTSPFVRKVMVCAHLTGQAERIEWLDSAAHPVVRDPRIAAHNPLAKVPTLILDDGQSLFDSRVICEYLAASGRPTNLFPGEGRLRWRALSLQALGDGLMDAALLARYESTARPEALRWPAWRGAQLRKVSACVEEIERASSALQVDDPTIGEVAIGSALGYLDFRYPELDWREGSPRAAAWHARFQSTAAMSATVPRDASGTGTGVPGAASPSKVVYFLNGPNANLYGLDANRVYGSESFPALQERCEKKAESLGIALRFLQSNHEGQLVDWIQEARSASQGLIINGAGLTYSSIPILDALLAFGGRIIEVHMSNIWRRETFRHHSYISKAADGVIAGLGGMGYELAVVAMSRLLDAQA